MGVLSQYKLPACDSEAVTVFSVLMSYRFLRLCFRRLVIMD